MKKHSALLAVLALIILYSAYFSALSIQRHHTLRTNASDLGQVDQALWNTLQGRFLEDTKPDGRQANRMTDHVEPTFALLALAYIFYDGVEAILVAQSLVIALGALPLFWIARKQLGAALAAVQGNRTQSGASGGRPYTDIAAIGFAAMYLMFPALQAANLAEVHAVTLAPAPLMLAYHYAQEQKWRRYTLFSLLALFVKEEIALLVFVMASYFATKAISEKRQASSLGLAAFSLLSLTWFFVAAFVIVPSNRLAGDSPYVSRYGCASDALYNWTTAIPQVVNCVFIPEKFLYLAQLFASVGFLAILDPLALLLGSPSLILNLLSSYPAMYSGTYHYSASIAPYFVLAAIGGAKRILDFKLQIASFKIVALGGAFLIALGYHAIAGYTPMGGEFFWLESTPHDALIARFAAQLPRDAKVSTMGSLFPHISHRRYVYRYPLLLDAEYVLLDIAQAYKTNPVDFRVRYGETLKQGFGVRNAADGYVLLQRGVATQDLPDAFYDFARAGGTEPQNRIEINFENQIRFLGYDVRQDDWQRVYLRTYWTRLSGMENLNYGLYPFFPDAEGAARADAQLPPLNVMFWYGSTRWRPGEVVIADTLPIEIGTRARIGLGVYYGASWDDAERHLKPRSSAPVSIYDDWVMLGEIERVGRKYIVLK